MPGEYGGAHVRARYPGSGMREIRKKSDSVATSSTSASTFTQKKGNFLNMYHPPTRQVVNEMGDNAIKCVNEAMSRAKHINSK